MHHAASSLHRERRLDRRRPPWLHPRDTAGLQLGDDLVGDFGVKARAVVAGTNSGGMSRHRGSPRRAPEASPPIFNPSRQTRPALSLLATVVPRALLKSGFATARRSLRRKWKPEGRRPAKRGFSAADGPVPGGIVANEYLESEMRTDEGPVSHAYVRERPSLLAKQTSMRARSALHEQGKEAPAGGSA